MVTNEQRESFDKVVDIISSCSMNSHLVLIGSWVEFLYEKNNILGSSYNSDMRTGDIDFLIRNKNVPARKTDFTERMENAGFMLDIDRSSGINRFFNIKSNMEVEFLLQERGKGQIEGYKIFSLGLTVEGLRHMDILQISLRTVIHNGNRILIPSPETYAIHKLVINNTRKEEKRNKDIESIINILDCLLEIPLKCVYFESLIDTLSKNEKKSLNNTINSDKRLTHLFSKITEINKVIKLHDNDVL